MTQELLAGLPLFDRTLIRLMATLVPVCGREEWCRTWYAELWHMHHPERENGERRLHSVADLAGGVLLDGLWLRFENVRLRLGGTAFLCLTVLLALNLLSAFVLLFQDHWLFTFSSITADLRDCSIASPLIILVACVANSNRHADQHARREFRFGLRLFSLAQIAQVLLLSFLLSVGLCLPLHKALPNLSDLLQMLCFVLCALLTLRWAILDQEQRCKQCLRTLTRPARVGRPSHNLLEWNGTELLCRNGHGQLSVPEIETSWCDASEWIDLNAA